MTPPIVVCLVGTPRSGSTVLQLILSRSEGVSALGEIANAGPHARCACGLAAAACPRWADALRGRVDRSPRALLGIALDLGSRERARAVIDGSKRVKVARAWVRAAPRRVKVVVLTRSPAGLLDAWARYHGPEQRPLSAAGSAALYGSILAELSALRAEAELLPLTTEALGADPIGAVEAIGRFAGIDVAGAVRALREDSPLPVGHVLGGNRLVGAGPARFRPPAPPPPPAGLRRTLSWGAMEATRRLLGW